jgi:hypothetical protein
MYSLGLRGGSITAILQYMVVGFYFISDTGFKKIYF